MQGYEIGSVEIDIAFRELAERRLRAAARQLNLDSSQVSHAADEMTREFKGCKERFGTEESMLQDKKRIRIPVISESTSLGSHEIIRGKMVFDKYSL
jgi:hypothetical protein